MLLRAGNWKLREPRFYRFPSNTILPQPSHYRIVRRPYIQAATYLSRQDSGKFLDKPVPADDGGHVLGPENASGITTQALSIGVLGHLMGPIVRYAG